MDKLLKAKDKEKNQHATYRQTALRETANFSSEALAVRRQWSDILEASQDAMPSQSSLQKIIMK